MPDKEFKIMAIRMFTKFDRIAEHSENFNEELENIKKNQSEFKNTLTEIEKKKKKTEGNEKHIR